MGDNVGGVRQRTELKLLAAIHAARVGSRVCMPSIPETVAACEQSGAGTRVTLSVGGKSDDLHGPPIRVEVTVRSLHDGKFREPCAARHGGITDFDQGLTAVCDTDNGLTLMLTSPHGAVQPAAVDQLRCRPQAVSNSW
ncbi:MAG: MlrC C-terminal domain-containing protein [Planctomycetaceae bacterium]